ncbi:MAG: DUF1338 family protein [Planctomycetes bacterium]|nr:DUF1338 family protein [Planctomycetota bacterium]
MNHNYVQPSWIRSKIVHQILAEFEETMPIYKQMMAVAREINTQAGASEAKRLGRIMHAAIRCASDEELQTIKDLFGLMKNEPVNYYDLRERVSVESTAFRPTSLDEIEWNGFRVFCSKLSLACIPAEHRPFVEEIIARRSIFKKEILKLIEIGKEQGGFDQQQAERFVQCCVEVFTRPDEAMISLQEYEKLKSINKVAAQVLVSNSLAFNHLTPSVASVPAAHEEMLRQGIKTIPVWQGPVGKDVILRQTSCLAPAITLKFPQGDGTFDEAEYQETFVEFEERLQALTPQGRKLFESMFECGKKSLTLTEGDPNYADHYYAAMREALAGFPSEPKELWNQKLAYFTFDVSEDSPSQSQSLPAKTSFEQLVELGLVRLIPQQYEDFFGPAATNIFNSNIGLKDVSNVGIAKPDSQKSYEAALGREVVNMYDYYEEIQAASQAKVCVELGVEVLASGEN